MMINALTIVLVTAGALFFMAGTVGLLRFPDLYTRLHALTKAENVGLGLIVVGLITQAETLSVILKLLVIWLLVQLAGASVAHLIAKHALQKGIPLWKR